MTKETNFAGLCVISNSLSYEATNVVLFVHRLL